MERSGLLESPERCSPLITIFSAETAHSLNLNLQTSNFNVLIKVIAFDADDTLWVNEPYFRNGR
jgi:hypothetical protein